MSKELKLDGKKLTCKHIGRRVIHTVPATGYESLGEITSYNESFVFVRLDGETQGKATNYNQLKWTK